MDEDKGLDRGESSGEDRPAGPAPDYAEIQRLLLLREDFDQFGFSQSIAELEQPGSLLPPAPPTLRGRLGSFFIRSLGGFLWWLLRAIRLRDAALAAAHRTMLWQMEESFRARRRLELDLEELRARLERLEEAARGGAGPPGEARRSSTGAAGGAAAR